MSENRDTKVAHEFHEDTKHSEISVKNSNHVLDFENKPRAFKIYNSLPQERLPADFPVPKINALVANSPDSPKSEESHTYFSLKDLAEILFFSGGITRKKKIGSNQRYFLRAASATGALYPIEIYVVCGKVSDIPAGVYHFDPGEFALTRIREGDFRSDLEAASGFSGSVSSSPTTIILTSLAWRNAWKYEARSYRHWFWDSGVIASNLLATVISLGLKPTLILGFIDERVSRLLGLVEEQEAPIALATISLPERTSREHTALETGSKPEKIRAEYLSISKEETDYPEIWKMNGASSLVTELEVSNWTKLSESIPQAQQKLIHGAIRGIEPDFPNVADPPSLGEVILQRGSTRRFDAEKAITFRQLSNVLYHSTRVIPSDFLPTGSSLIDIYLISNSVGSLPSGAYFFDRAKNSLRFLKSGEFRSISSYLCLEQPLFGDASAVFFLMARLDPILGYLGNRGYRASQFEAGVIAGKIYLCAYAPGIGASGSTFYDDAVTEFFSPHAEGKSTMIVVGIGVPAYTAKPGKILAGKISRDEILA